ncbi:hypothetical protein IAD21_02428 [Abditibacteriota bacterium]|nr:hypothetical protein IAD21_02428 [Abditibacteriota bacterium]
MDDYLFNYIFRDGDWEPCIDLIGLQGSNEEWEAIVERSGLQREPLHTVGHADGFRVEVYYRIRGRLFEPDNTITQLIVVASSSDWTHYYCPGHHVMHRKFAELSIPCLAEHVSSELGFAVKRMEESGVS